jgi:hypothetical protein
VFSLWRFYQTKPWNPYFYSSFASFAPLATAKPFGGAGWGFPSPRQNEPVANPFFNSQWDLSTVPINNVFSAVSVSPW